MKDLPIVGLAFGPFFMVFGSLNPQGWQMVVGFAGSVMLALSLLAMWRAVNRS